MGYQENLEKLRRIGAKLRGWIEFAQDWANTYLEFEDNREDVQGILHNLEALRYYSERLAWGSLVRIAVAGPFSAGKTTIVNAILGSNILPTGLSETTAIPTLIRHGFEERLLIPKGAGNWVEATDQEEDEFFSLTPSSPTNKIKKFHPYVIYESPNAPPEVEIFDLPGTSGVNKEVEESSLAAVEASEAVIYVVNGQQGIRDDEKKILKNLVAKKPYTLVLTHFDRIPPSQRKRALHWAENTLKDMPPLKILGVEKGKADWTKIVTDLHRKTGSAGQNISKTLNIAISKIEQLDVPGALALVIVEKISIAKEEGEKIWDESYSMFLGFVNELNECVHFPHWVGAAFNIECGFKKFNEFVTKLGNKLKNKLAEFEYNNDNIQSTLSRASVTMAINYILDLGIGIIYGTGITGAFRFELQGISSKNLGSLLKDILEDRREDLKQKFIEQLEEWLYLILQTSAIDVHRFFIVSKGKEILSELKEALT